MALNMQAQVLINAGVTGEDKVRRLSGEIKGLDSSAKSLAGLRGALSGTLAPLTGLLTGAALVGYAKSAADAASEQRQMAEAIGTTVTKFSELKFAFAQNEVGSELFSRAMVRLNVQLDEAAQGNEKAVATMAKFGITQKQIREGSVDSEKALRLIADKFQELPNGIEKAGLAQEVFGKGSARLILTLNEGSEGLDKYAQQAHDVGAVLDDISAGAVARANDKLKQIADTIETRVIVTMAALLGASPFGQLDEQIISTQEEIAQLGVELKKLKESGGLVKSHGDTFLMPDYDERVKLLTDRIKALNEQLDKMNKQFMGGGDNKPPKGRSGGDDGTEDRANEKRKAELQQLLGTYDSEAEALKKLTEAQIKLNEAFVRGDITQEQLSRGMDGIAEAYANLGAVEEDFTEETKAANQALKEQQELEKHLADLYENNIGFITGLSDAQLEYNRHMTELNELLARGKINEEEYRVAVERLGESLEDTNSGFMVFADQAGRNMQSIVANFLSGQMAGENFGRAMISMLRRLAAELLATIILTETLNAIGGATGVPGLGSMVFGGGRAGGGGVAGGRVYEVGEKGPEILSSGGRQYLIPDKSGAVSAAPSSAGSRTIQMTSYVDARNATDPGMIITAMERTRRRTVADVAQLLKRGYLGVSR